MNPILKNGINQVNKYLYIVSNMINNFEKFNESNSLNTLKNLAKEYIESGGFSKDISASNIDKGTLFKTFNEVNSAIKKSKGIDNLFSRIKKKSESRNESIIAMTFLSFFGLHFFIKTLIAIRNGYNFKEYLAKLLASRSNPVREVRDVLISVTFLIYVIYYCISNMTWTSDVYKVSKNDNVYTEWAFRNCGVNDFEIRDSYGKIYKLKYNSLNNFDIIYKGNKIGVYNDWEIYSNDPNISILDKGPSDHQTDITSVKIDLEKFLKHNKIKNTDKIQLLNQISKDREAIDSLSSDILTKRIAVFENKTLSKKILSDYKLDYDNLTEESVIMAFPNLNPLTIIDSFNSMKHELASNSNMGYIGLFTKLLINKATKINKIVSGNVISNIWTTHISKIYKKIIENRKVISNIRDSSGNIKDIMSFDDIESIDDSLNRLADWRKVNTFMKRLPPKQKNLIWKDGYFINSLKSQSQSITSSILCICNDRVKESTFLSKISSIKTTDDLIDNIMRVSKKIEWDYNTWLKFLDNTKNVVISYKKENIIICAVFGFEAIKEIAYMTNWCIVRSEDYYNDYTSNGNMQYILYDFNKSDSDNSSVIGLTVKSNLEKRSCHDKSDRGYSLPNKFYINGIINKEYITLSIKDLYKKLTMSSIKVVIWKFQRMISSSKKLSNFLDYYNGDNY